MKKLFIALALVLVALTVNANESQDSSVVISQDTINVLGELHIQECVNSKGNTYFKATYMGRNVRISKKSAEDILEGSDAFIIFSNYSNGERKITKAISPYNN